MVIFYSYVSHYQRVTVFFTTAPGASSSGSSLSSDIGGRAAGASSSARNCARRRSAAVPSARAFSAWRHTGEPPGNHRGTPGEGRENLEKPGKNAGKSWKNVRKCGKNPRNGWELGKYHFSQLLMLGVNGVNHRILKVPYDLTYICICIYIYMEVS